MNETPYRNLIILPFVLEFAYLIKWRLNISEIGPERSIKTNHNLIFRQIPAKVCRLPLNPKSNTQRIDKETSTTQKLVML